MKLRIYNQPWIAVALFALGTMMAAITSFVLPYPLSWFVLVVGTFWGTLLLISIYSCIRLQFLESWFDWHKPERLMIIAPHQDDCIISAGGIGIRNQALGGHTQIVYLVQDEDPALARRRREETIRAWSLAGIEANSLLHLDLLPPLQSRDPNRINAARQYLAELINAYNPTVVIVPMFEGGHVHHDVANHIVGAILHDQEDVSAYEAPEYSPYLSLRNTPHKVIALCTRWLFALISYYGPPDGIDNRRILKLKMTQEELSKKTEMLRCFASQNGASLALTRSYPDRIVRMAWYPAQERPMPFKFQYSGLWAIKQMASWIPERFLGLVLPLQTGTVGIEWGVTDLRQEVSEDVDHNA